MTKIRKKIAMICSMIAAHIRSSAEVASPRVTGDFPSAMASLQVGVSRAVWAKPCGNSEMALAPKAISASAVSVV